MDWIDDGMKTVLILEDNVKSYKILAQLLQEIDETIHILYAATLGEAYVIAMDFSIDLFLLDIILNPGKTSDLSGIRFADAMRKIPHYEFTPIIFITAMEDPKLYAYSDLHCYSFIEKPYDREKTGQILRQALRMPHLQEEKEYAYFRKDNILYKKELDAIIYIENSRFGQTVHTVEGEMRLSYQPCREILSKLGSDRFIQCSRFTIINWQYVENIDKSNRYLQLKGVKKRIDIGRAYLHKLLKELEK